MERSPYFENYINNLQKDIFLLAFESNIEIVDFITCYMKSKIRFEMDKPYTFWHTQPSIRIFEEIILANHIKKIDKQKINIDAVEWLGFFYSKWHFLTGESSKSIISFLPAIEGLRQYYVLHQLDEVEAIEIAKRHYNLSRNAHRLNEYSNSKESNNEYSDPIYYSFLSVRLLYKLWKDQIFDLVKYAKDYSSYDFLDDDYKLGIKGDVIFSKDNTDIIQKYKQAEKDIVNCLRRSEKSIYFCFVFSSIYESNDERFELDIRVLRKEYPPINRNFNSIYFYRLGKLYEINSSNELYVYSLPLSKRERMGILKKMKEYGLIAAS